LSVTACIAFRADGSLELGSGHLMRCLALASELKEGGSECIFFSRAPSASLASLIASGGHRLVEMPAQQPAAPLDPLRDAERVAGSLTGPIDWAVVDHYGLDAAWERSARAWARRILVIDDMANRAHDCDILLDQNYSLRGSDRYEARVPLPCRLLLGPRYALLRPEFRRARERATPRTGKVSRLFVFFGGADAADCTSAALAALSRIDYSWESVDVVIGAQNQRKDRIAGECERQGFRLHVQTPTIADLMCDADLALGAGGSASWERCCVGLPALLVAVAENQQALVEDSESGGFAFSPSRQASYEEHFVQYLGFLLKDPERIQGMSRKGMELVDGRGASRVRRAMGVTTVKMRPARPHDARNVFEWRNHPDIRRHSINHEPIDWKTHESWFTNVLRRPDRVLLIAESSGEPAGVIRFDLDDAAAEVSIYKVPARARLPAGGELLAAAENWLTSHHPDIRQLTATVLPGNEISRRMFLSAGYSGDGLKFSKRMHA
jgi:UDP-2,4-diacetamido-2,4,6-trideoxy-beta-L-altropyranose hydrolase